MARSKRRGREGETNYWIGYTDLLSNSLLVLLLTIAVAALARANNEKPPFLPLTEKESFRFGTGSYQLTPQFKAALNSKLPWIQEQIKSTGLTSLRSWATPTASHRPEAAILICSYQRLLVHRT